jgi:CIC family chloride channel protein
MLATSLTLGSGNSGGVFAPSLFMGATLGGIVGLAANHFWPGIAPNPGAYAIVGMAATFSGAARAPITAVLIVFEMSSDYKLIIPLMLATVLSTLIAEALHDESIYTLKLKEKGIRWQRGRDIDVLQSVTVGEIISRNFDSVPADFTLPELTERFEQTHRHGLPILDEDGKLCGLLTISDLDRALDDNKPSETTALEIGVPLRDLLVTTPEETMGAALALMGTRGLGRLPVVDPTDRSRLLGMVRRSDIIRAYYIALARRAEIQHRAKRQAMTNIDGTIFTDFILEEGDKAVGKRLAELSPNFPKACILVSIRRSGRLLIPHGETVFQAGDKVTVFVNTQDVDQIQSCLRQNSAGQEEHVAEHEG